VEVRSKNETDSEAGIQKNGEGERLSRKRMETVRVRKAVASGNSKNASNDLVTSRRSIEKEKENS
jgi:uncharacterized protein involved in type VI secretion and phage assembly